MSNPASGQLSPGRDAQGQFRWQGGPVRAADAWNRRVPIVEQEGGPFHGMELGAVPSLGREIAHRGAVPDVVGRAARSAAPRP